MKRPSTRAITVGLLLAPLAHFQAQNTPSAGTAERSIDQTGRIVPVFSSWPYGARASRPIAPGVALMLTARWQILLSVPASYELLPKDEPVSQVITECREQLKLSDEDVRSLRAARPFCCEVA